LALHGSLAARAQESNELVVYVSSIPPCAIVDGTKLKGFEVDLWEYCAKSLGRRFTYKVVGSADEKIQGLADNEADVAIAGISVTREREDKVDFSIPTLNSGLRIMVLKDTGLLPKMSDKSRGIVRTLIVFLLICAHVLWWAERGGGAVKRTYFPGIFEAFWCVFATMTTVGYGDIAPKRWLGRVMGVLIMFSGITLFGIFAATLTADLVTEKRLSAISSVDDLKTLAVGVKRNTTSSRYLKRQGVQCREADTFELACQSLADGHVDAVVYDEPAILYWIKRNPNFIAVGPLFNSQYYAFGFPDDSTLLEDVNKALLESKEDGFFDETVVKWFGEK
jgi:polar amino acid transport system substrate-binding protein